MKTNRTLLFIAWLFLVSPSVRAGDLTCWILATSSKPKPDDSLPVELIVKNNGAKPVRICTLYIGGYSGGTEGGIDATLSPDWWKTNPPSLEECARHISTIESGAIAHLPFDVYTNGERKLQIKASYAVSDKLASKLNVWSGGIKADPIDIEVTR